MSDVLPVELRVLAPAFEACAGERLFTLVPTNVNQLLGVRFLLRLAVSVERADVPHFVLRRRFVAGTKQEFADAVDVPEAELPRRVSEEPRQALARIFSRLGVTNPLVQEAAGWTIGTSGPTLTIDLVTVSCRFTGALQAHRRDSRALASELADVLAEFEKCFSNLDDPTAHELTVVAHLRHMDEEVKLVHRAILAEHLKASELSGDDARASRSGAALFANYRDSSDAAAALAYYRSASGLSDRRERLRQLISCYGDARRLPAGVRAAAASDMQQTKTIGHAALTAGERSSSFGPNELRTGRLVRVRDVTWRQAGVDQPVADLRSGPESQLPWIARSCAAELGTHVETALSTPGATVVVIRGERGSGKTRLALEMVRKLAPDAWFIAATSAAAARTVYDPEVHQDMRVRAELRRPAVIWLDDVELLAGGPGVTTAHIDSLVASQRAVLVLCTRGGKGESDPGLHTDASRTMEVDRITSLAVAEISVPQVLDDEERARATDVLGPTLAARLYGGFVGAISEARLGAEAALVPEPTQVDRLLDEADAAEAQGDYLAILRASSEALSAAVADRDVARARTALSRALLQTQGDPEEAWRLADLAADPALLSDYPDLSFHALRTKIDAAIETGRLQVAQGAIAALSDLATSDGGRRIVLQFQARFALATGNHAEAARLYSDAATSFVAALIKEANAEARTVLMRGAGACSTNQAIGQRASGDVVGAIGTLLRAAVWYADAGSPVDESVVRRLVARYHFDEQEWSEGLESLDRAQALAKAADAKFALVDCIELRARALATTDNLDEARTVLADGLALLDGDPDIGRRFHQMLATLADEAGEADVARGHLERARLLAERLRDPLKVADVEHQMSRVGKKGRDHDAAPLDLIAALGRKLRETQQPAAAARLMHQIGGAHRSHRNLDKARGWYKRAHRAAMAVSDHALAASALIGIAEIVLTDDTGDDEARRLLEEALELVKDLPAWEVQASTQYFLGRVEARNGELERAQLGLRKAHETATTHHIGDLEKEVGEYLSNIDDALGLRRPPGMSFESMANELEMLEGWYPDARRRLRRFWYYQRSDEILQNLRSHGGAKALIVSETAGEVARVARNLQPLFDVTVFATEEPFVGETEATMEFVPIPESGVWPFINFVGVVKEKREAEES
jgi:tetratricopeptide (TPR) repeat protein